LNSISIPFCITIITVLTGAIFFSPSNSLHANTYANNLADSSTALRIESILKEMNALMAQKSDENRAKNLVGESSGQRYVPFYSQVLDISDYKRSWF